ncbi:MAG: porin family protein [Bacteroidaceae bacterium]|nr:PorT family protein [Bacteroidaceae bacterium]
MKNIILLILGILVPFVSAIGQNESSQTLINAEKNGWEYEMKFGINIGGASPIPLPESIRSIESYNPKFNGMIEGNATRWIGDSKKWGISAGIRIESKGMHAGATVKSYSTEVVDDGSKVSGYWTGYVNTKYNSILMTVPIMANYKLNDRWNLRAGIYMSYMLDGDFSGYVSDGYLRQGTPTGQKILFTNGKQGTYNFSDDLRHIQTGIQIGASWLAYKHFRLNGDLEWGLNDIFEKNFKTVSFNMYPIYLNIGFGYKF